MSHALLLPAEVALRGGAATLLLLAAEALPAFRARPGWRRLWWIGAAAAFLLPFSLLPGRVSPAPWFALVWIGGAALLLGLVAFRTWRTARRWSRRRLVAEGPLPALLEDCKARAGVTAPIGLVLAEPGELPGPVLLGWLRPRILLPRDLAEALSREELEAVLLHELVHFRALDVPGDWVFALARSVQWFNPFAHLAHRRWREAREEAADAETLALLVPVRPDAGSFYGALLLRLIRRQHEAPFLPHGALAVAESHATLKRRLQMIVAHSPASPRRLVPCLALTVGLACLLAATVVVAPLSADPATANAVPNDKIDAEKQAALAAIQEWLKLEDAGKHDASWKAASDDFRNEVSQAQWVFSSNDVHTSIGACRSRKLASILLEQGTVETGSAPLPHPIVIAQFQTTFEKTGTTVETVSFAKENDGVWRADGYYIKPSSTPAGVALDSEDEKAAVAAMGPWLKKGDAGDYAGQWNDASETFKKGCPLGKWLEASRNVSGALGATVSRTLLSAKLDAPGNGTAVVAKYATSFRNAADITETVVFLKEPGNVWRASAYYTQMATR